MDKPTENPQKPQDLTAQNNNEQNYFAFPLDREHPLLNNLILKNIFEYLKGENNATTTIAHLRVVCKTWDGEIVKILRNDTQTNLTKILTPYPDGMGWTASPQNLERTYHYKVPYEEVHSFKSVVVVADLCENFKNRNWLDWFQIMGSEVKSLKFSSPFNCFCQNHFLERILKEWCPNLKYLELCDVKRVDSLLISSSFLQTATRFAFKDLKHLKISANDIDYHSYSLCPDKANLEYKANRVNIRYNYMCISVCNVRLVELLCELGRESSNPRPFLDIVNSTEPNEILPVELVRSIRETDGGIIGQLMKEVNVEQLCIHGFNQLSSLNLATFFHFRSNQWQFSLQSLELNGYLSKSFDELELIAQVKFPLTTIKLSELHSSPYNLKMTRFLSRFSKTLKHLEISGPSVQEQILEVPSVLILPVLPKLKTFVHENIFSCNLSAKNLWKNAPILETCYLKASLAGGWNTNIFFGNSTAVFSTAMKKLELVARISGYQAEMLLNWFPNLLEMELVLNNLKADTRRFFGKLGMSKVKRLSLTFFGCGNQIREMVKKGKAAIIWEASNIAGLESLELNNMSDLILPLDVKQFSDGKLRSLKLHNFRFSRFEKEKLLSGLSHIPCVKFIKTE